MLQASPEVQHTISREERRRGALLEKLFAPVDIAPLVFFRIAFGLLMLIEIAAYTFSGYLRQHWIDPQFHFTYYGFGWVVKPPGNWMYVLAGLLMLSAGGLTSTVVGSVALEPADAPPDTVTELICGDAASLLTFTETTMGG